DGDGDDLRAGGLGGAAGLVEVAELAGAGQQARMVGLAGDDEGVIGSGVRGHRPIIAQRRRDAGGWGKPWCSASSRRAVRGRRWLPSAWMGGGGAGLWTSLLRRRFCRCFRGASHPTFGALGRERSSGPSGGVESSG